MEKKIVYVEGFSGRNLIYRFQYPDTYRYMLPYIQVVEGNRYDIEADHEYIDRHRPFYTENKEDAYIEYKSLIGLTSKALLPQGACIMHGVAVKIDGYCLLITAPSGTGKTTQYYNMKALYGKKVQMVCGDMPVLDWTEEGKILVRPSPWNGKERIKGKEAVPLGGILFLVQGTENTIRRLDPAETAFRTLLQLAIIPDTEEESLQMTSFADRLLRSYPVWEMINLGDTASSRLAAETFRTYVKEYRHDL